MGAAVLKYAHDYSVSVFGSWLRAVLEHVYHIIRHDYHSGTTEPISCPMIFHCVKAESSICKVLRNNTSRTKVLNSLCGAREASFADGRG